MPFGTTPWRSVKSCLTPCSAVLCCLLWPLSLGAQNVDLAARAAEAKRAMDAREYGRAAELYEELARALPENAGLRMNVGLARFSAGEFESAAASLNAAARMDARLWPARLMLGMSYLKLGRVAEAIAPLESVVRERPDDKVARLELAAGLLQLGRFGDAVSVLQKLAGLDPANPKVWYGLGLAHEGMARDAAERVLAERPESSYALALTAKERAEGQQFVSAVQLYREALSWDSTLPGAHAAIAAIYRTTDHADWAAVEDRRAAEAEKPDCARQPRACAFVAGRFAEAAAGPPGGGVADLYWQSLAHSELAREALARLEILPPSAELHQSRAEQLERAARYADAVREWKAAVALAPRDERLRRGYAQSLWRARDYDAAIPLLRELAAAHPDAADFFYQLGDSLLEKEGPAAGLPYLERALELDRGSLPARASLGKALMRAGRGAEAIPHLEATRPIDSDGSVHYQLAQAYRAAGNADGARAAMAAFAKLREDNEAAQAERNLQTAPPPP
jgi:predicted Zn-dependent protease